MHIFDYQTAPANLLTPEITALLSAIHEFKGKQELYLNAKPDILNALVEVAKLQSTTSSNRIEGISTTDARMRELMSQKTIPRNRNEQEITGYRDVLKTIHESHDFIPISPNILLQLHRDLYSKLPQGIGGHWKLNDNVIEETEASGNASIRFRPASAVETPAAMDELCAAYRKAIATERFDALLLIAMFVFDFLCVHPFHDGNGRMSRLLTLLLLYRSGFMVGKYISLEMLIENSKADYYEALQASSSHWHENGNDMRPFVQYTLGIVLKAYRELESRVEGLVTSRMSKADRIRAVVGATLGKVTKRDILAKCPDISTAMVELTLKTLEKDIDPQRAHPDIVVLDPPRAGAKAKVCTKIANSGAPIVVYIACDPASLARFHSLGFTLFVMMAAWQLFDAADVIISGALKGAGDTKFVMCWMLIASFALWLPGVFAVRHFHNTMPALWLTMIVYVVVICIGSLFASQCFRNFPVR